MKDYKYKCYYNGESYLGNSIDFIAQNITKDDPSVNFKDMVLYVQKNKIDLKPGVYKTTATNNITSNSFKGKKSLSVDQMTNGAKAALRQISGDTVSQQEINRRSDICFNCPLRSQASICGPCGQGAKLVSLVNKVKNFFGKGIKINNAMEQDYCTACGCSLAMLLPATLDQIDMETRQDPDRPDFCWMKVN